MNSKRSYLDTLNAGRQRRPHTTLEQLNRSLETLEQRLGRSRQDADEYGDRRDSLQSEPRYARTDPYAQRSFETARPQRVHDEPRYQQRPSGRRPEQNYQSLARDIDRVRGQEDGVAMVGKIANELRGLREELRHQMTSGLQREFGALRKDIDRSLQSGPSAKHAAELNLEFERLSAAIRLLSEKGEDRNVSLLRLELEQVKAALDTLAREESVQAVDRRWDDFDRRWNAFEDRFVGDGKGAGLDALSERLEQISRAVNSLPDSLPLRSLEDKIRTLAGAVDHFTSQQNAGGSQTFGLIDERLDEISRAIVASTVASKSNMFDPAPFERIEQRIDSLARQIEEVAENRPANAVMDQLESLSNRVDDLATRAQLPEQAIDRLGRQIASIVDKIDQGAALPEADQLLQGLEQRFDMLSSMFERRQGDAIEHGNMLFRDLERRLDEVADRLDRHTPEASFDSAGIMEAIDARFTALAQRLETRSTDSASEAAIRGLESRLADISTRLDSSAAQFAGIDPELIRSLEAQVSGLSAHLSKPGTPLPEFEDISPRIEKIEQSIAGSRDSILEAARQAAENAVRAMGAGSAEGIAVSGLAQDLKQLETLTRRSDERNTKTFEAIHDTLLKIVDRLGSLEPGSDDNGNELPAAKLAVHDAPTLAMDDPMPFSADMDHDDRLTATARAVFARTPAEAAAEAARAAVDVDAVETKEQPEGRRKSILGGLAKALSGRKDASGEPTVNAPASEAPAVSLDEPLEPTLVNRPLEPGSGAPDLSAIMKRVRDERGQPARQNEGDAAKSDFIAAARRAAQAAAAEAEVLKKQSSLGGPVKALRLGDLLKARRKPVLMAAAAIMLALAGLQLGKAFLSDPQVASIDVPSVTSEPAAEATTAEASNAPPLASEQEAPAPEMVRVVGQDEPAGNAAIDTLPAGKAKDDIEMASMTAVPAPAMPSTQTGEMQASEVPASTAMPATADTTGAVPPAQEQASAAKTFEVPSDIGTPALREAAAGGDAKALFEIGSRYAEARGVKEDMPAAAKWYEAAANLGFAPAEYRIGNFYEKGIGVGRDIEKSKSWYRKAAEQGNASAMHNLAVLFAMGADGKSDNEASARWFHEAADLGVKDSQFNLGILAAKGVGMQQNLEESYKWFALVAKTGDKDAASKRDEIANALRPEQLERARAATELWKAKSLNEATNSLDIPDAWQEAPTTTASIDMKKAVQNIQRILNKNGYDAGGADGVMGQKTKDAIIAFQGDNDLPATGKVDEKLVKALIARK
ncbi:peptidoglycan-binding protein [Mesorhizobium sp. Root554]|uniref:peptidoglycan-binding protein n=1 Tax=unclassified Mesorhizobium TaxID=325217 RepID=UPI0007006BC7|nr:MULTISPECIES: peptidoglycan-binding protein [unclassified Mesorhizobium]KQZ15566.1 peptidoglycan-binding protein [Mesorhizobium sp. Root1471]KQZ38074.1 peptidoglycan-binding protein [Mesorhizobium sp. Root554]